MGGGYYKNSNNKFNLNDFTKRSHPLGEVIEGESMNHQFFALYISSMSNHFNGQYPFNYPLDSFEYQIKDSLIQGINYANALCLPHSWVNSTLENAIESEIYVQDIGVVKFTTVNKDTYELINHSIN